MYRYVTMPPLCVRKCAAVAYLAAVIIIFVEYIFTVYNTFAGTALKFILRQFLSMSSCALGLLSLT